MAAFYSVTANKVSWLGSHPHAPQWVAGQNLADSTTWKCSSLTTLKQLHDQFLMHYNCTEWAPPPPAGPAAAPAPDAPAPGRDDDSARPLSLPPLNLLASLRARQVEEMAMLLLVRRYLHNVKSQSASCKAGCGINRYCKIRPRPAA